MLAARLFARKQKNPAHRGIFLNVFSGMGFYESFFSTIFFCKRT